MGITDKILKRFGLATTRQFSASIEEAVKRELDKMQDWLGETADAQRWDVPAPYIYANQADMYRLSPILGTALDILADDVGLSKFNVKRMVGEEERDIPNHEFEFLLQRPNPMDSGLEFMRDTTMNYKLNGNSIWWLNRTDKYDKPLEIWTIPYEMVEIVPDKQMYISHYLYYPGAGKPAIPLPTWQIVHFKTYNPRSRFWGLSPIESLAETLMGNQGMRHTKAQTYTTYNGSPPDIISFPDWINNEAWNEIQAKVRKSAQENRTLLLRGAGTGVSWMSRAMSSKDAEFIQQLQQDMRDVFARIAPGLLAMLDSNATEANALAARATYSEKALWKTLVTIAQKITAEILPVYGRKLVGEFDDPRVVDRRLELREQVIYGQTHTIEEVRKKYYGDDPLGDERDKLLVSEVEKSGGGFGTGNEIDTETDDDVDTEEDTGDDDMAVKAIIADLERLKKIAMRGNKVKIANFESFVIPSTVLTGIKSQLAKTNNKNTIKNIFNSAVVGVRKQPDTDVKSILQGIELGVKALEVSK